MKKALIAIAMLALSAAAAHADITPCRQQDVCSPPEQSEWAVKIKPSFADIIPPPEYDHPYRGTLIVTKAQDQSQVRWLCPGAKWVDGYPTLACSMRLMGDTCQIVLAPDVDIWEAGFTVAVVKRHEIAHCNGWPAGHPGVRDWEGM